MRICPLAQAADICLAVDASGSISASDWTNFKNFSHDLVNDLPIEEGEIHLGIVEFNTGAKLITPLNFSQDRLNNVITNDLAKSPDGNTQ